jgi:hypothetical protein
LTTAFPESGVAVADLASSKLAGSAWQAASAGQSGITGFTGFNGMNAALDWTGKALAPPSLAGIICRTASYRLISGRNPGLNVQIFTTGGILDKVYFDALSGIQNGEPMAPEILRAARRFEDL